MAGELLDVINENNGVTGQEIKGAIHQKGLRHRVRAVLLQNSEGKYLIPTASNKKVEASLVQYGMIMKWETISKRD